MRPKSKKIGVLGALAAALGLSGCYVMHGPYLDVKVSSPHMHARPPANRIYVAPRREPQIVYEECHAYAASAADSMRTNGRRLVVCTCHDSDSPQDTWTCNMYEK